MNAELQAARGLRFPASWRVEDVDVYLRRRMELIDKGFTGAKLDALCNKAVRRARNKTREEEDNG